MRDKILKLRQDRAKILADSRALLDKASSENRDLTDEESNNWDKMIADAASLMSQVERMERQLDLDNQNQQSQGVVVAGSDGGEGRQLPGGYVFRSRGMAGLDSGFDATPEWEPLLSTMEPERCDNYRNYIRGNVVSRSLQSDLDAQGGYLVTPMQMVDDLIKAIDDIVFIRPRATVFAVPNAQSLGVPTLENDPSDADWTTELQTGNEDTAMSFGRRELHPHPLAKRIKISRKLIQQVPTVEALVNSRLAYKFGITQEKSFLLGSGSGQPLGVFVASDDGIPTSRDVSTGNKATAVTFDGLIEAKYTLKPQYWPTASWLGHRDLYKTVAKLKDNDGQYLWRESVRVGEPDRVLGLPVAMSEYAPNTFTANQYVGILGDFSNYWIADSMAMTMQRLVELYAETNQVGLIGRLDTDGQPTLAEAFVRVQLGS